MLVFFSSLSIRLNFQTGGLFPLGFPTNFWHAFLIFSVHLCSYETN